MQGSKVAERVSAGRLLRALAGAVLLAHGAALAQPSGNSLFTTDPVGALPGSSDDTRSRHRIARIDTERLGVLRDEVMAGRTKPLRLNLFQDVEYRASLERSAPTASGYTLSGPLDGVPFGRVVLVVNDGKTYGRVYAPEGSWSIRTVGKMQTVEPLTVEPTRCGLEAEPATDGTHWGDADDPHGFRVDHRRAELIQRQTTTTEAEAIRTFKRPTTLHRREGNDETISRRGGLVVSRGASKVVDTAQDDGNVVDVLVVYPSFVRDLEGGYAPLLSLIDLDIATANEAYAASRVELRVELAAAVEVEYDWFLDAAMTAVSGGGFVSSEHYNTALDHLRNREDGFLDEVHDLRDRYAADFVLLHLGGQIAPRVASSLREHHPVAGIAFGVYDVTSEVLEERGFAIARSGDGTIMAHELGHSMGLHHDRFEHSFNRPFPYSHGFVYDHAAPIPDEPGETYPTVTFGTIMSQYSHRAYPGFVLAFSNPDLVHPEDPSLRLGVPGDEPSSAADGPADAARHLNELSAVLANVRARADAETCRYEVTGETGVLPAAGGTYHVRVDTQPGCAWTASGGEWVSSVSSREGIGSADISYAVGTNEGFGRPVEILVAGKVHARTQAGTRSITPVCERSNSIKHELMHMHPDYVAQINPPFADGTPCGDLDFDADFLASISTFNPDPTNPRHVWRGLKVREMRAGDFDGLTGVSTLRVNGFEELPSHAFAGLTGLRILNLGQELEWKDDDATLRSIEPGAFKGVPGLRMLQIDGHRLRRLDDGTFEGLTGLVHLRVTGAQAGALALEEGAFDDMNDLRLLQLADNGIRELPLGMFSGLTELRSLGLLVNRISALPKGVFDGLSALLLLDLRLNEIETFQSGAFDGLSSLEVLLGNGIQLSTVEAGAFDVPSRLKELHLPWNHLDDVPVAALSTLASLDLLDLHDNRIAALEPGDFRALSELRHLYLYSNRIARIEARAFYGLSKLDWLSLNDNGTRSIASGAFEGLGSLSGLDLSENRLGVLRDGMFDGLDNLQSLWLDLSGVTVFEAGLFEATPWLTRLFARGNEIRRLGGGALLGLRHTLRAELSLNPGTPFTVAPTPVLVEAGNVTAGQPVEIALEVTSAAPFDVRASVFASGGTVSREVFDVSSGNSRSWGRATVIPDGDGPVTVRIAGEPALVTGASYPDACGSGVLIGPWPRACYRGLRLAAGPPLVLYGIEDRSLIRGQRAEHIDLAEVFAYFVGPADYSVSTSDEVVAAVGVDDETLTVTPGATGTAEITVTAHGAGGETLTRRFTVTVGVPSIPLFLSAASPAREGFVRVLNHSDRSGTVHITAIDDGGARYGPVRLRLRPYGAAQFNSKDLEEGNDAKRLLDGVGVGFVEGDWRLEFESDLDIEPLSYVRTEDGFLTPIHDVAPFADGVRRIATFNPASNVRQSSRLRVINSGREAAEITIRGIDDTGASPGSPVRFSVSAGAAREFDAMQLETGDPDLDGALGDGEGKWRLAVEADSSVVVMSLLENTSTGHLTNLSSVPPPPDDNGIHHVALLPAVGDGRGRQGFVRVINRSQEAGVVRIDAFDDAGAVYGPLELAVEVGAVAHFSSDDLEFGAAGKGLTGSTGKGEGDWRLELSSGQDVEVLAYARSEDGFLTTLHDTVAVRDGRREVVLFNPGSNATQASHLRLSNPLSREARVGIRGTDDVGALPGNPVFLYLPPRSAVTLTAGELEAGDPVPDFEGSWNRLPLGDGEGKWRLSVNAEAGVLVQSLLESPTGHLTNLSTGWR